MEKEKPMLFEDLIPPGEIDTYVPGDDDVIPIRTWSRGDPYDIDGGFQIPLPKGKGSVCGSQSTDGMLHYTIPQVFDGQGQIEEEPCINGQEDDDQDGGDYNEDYEDDGAIPNYQFAEDGEAEGDEYDDDNDYEEEDGEDDEDGGEEGEDDGNYEDEEGGGGGEEDDEVNYDDGESEYLIGPDETNNGSFTIDNEQFEKVTLSPRELDLIASSGPGEFNDLVDIMNEYNELVNYLSSPRSHAKKPVKHHAGAAVKAAGDKAPAMKTAKTAHSVPPVQRRILQSDSEEEEEGDGGDDEHSASNKSLLARNKLNIVTGMISNATRAPTQKVPKKSKKSATAAPAKVKKPKKKLFGYALEQQKQMAVQLKLVPRSEVDDKLKVR